jgi:hypothetical protein
MDMKARGEGSIASKEDLGKAKLEIMNCISELSTQLRVKEAENAARFAVHDSEISVLKSLTSRPTLRPRVFWIAMAIIGSYLLFGAEGSLKALLGLPV